MEFLISPGWCEDQACASSLAEQAGLPCQVCPGGGGHCAKVDLFAGELTLAEDVPLPEEDDACFLTVEGAGPIRDSGVEMPDCEPSCAGTGGKAVAVGAGGAARRGRAETQGSLVRSRVPRARGGPRWWQ